jgi:DNA-binding response OmpR family regulator
MHMTFIFLSVQFLRYVSSKPLQQTGQPMNQPKRILLIDDETVTTFGYTRVLQEPGIEVDSAHTLKEAEQLITEKTYDAAIVDLRLSNSVEIEGLTCVRLLRDKQRNCRVIVLTAYGDKRLREETIELGVALFLEKPMSPARIRETLKGVGIYNN